MIPVDCVQLRASALKPGDLVFNRTWIATPPTPGFPDLQSTELCLVISIREHYESRFRSSPIQIVFLLFSGGLETRYYHRQSAVRCTVLRPQ